MRGLVNRGTNCSLNSVVQCLYGTRELRGLIREASMGRYDLFHVQRDAESVFGAITGRSDRWLYARDIEHDPCVRGRQSPRGTAGIARVQRVCGDTVKTGKRLAFPETLDLKCITKGPGVNAEDPYELYAVVAHRDDTRVTLCSWRDVKRTYEAGSIMCDGVAYMLMYQRKHSR
ncbi:hypothetical protein KUCAC02_033056 [Chaenocephalus aceratus]|nr:hypothetical protein KUCAC02_033056 [Chaenocephalus aceratus]